MQPILKRFSSSNAILRDANKILREWESVYTRAWELCQKWNALVSEWEFWHKSISLVEKGDDSAMCTSSISHMSTDTRLGGNILTAITSRQAPIEMSTSYTLHWQISYPFHVKLVFFSLLQLSFYKLTNIVMFKKLFLASKR